MTIACEPLNEGGYEENENENENENANGTDGYEDIKVVNGKVRFYLSEAENSTRTATDISDRNWFKSQVIMNGQNYDIELTDDQQQRPYIEVDKADKYDAVLITDSSDKLYGNSAYEGIILPPSQIHNGAIANIKSYPMYASYSKENGNKLIFNDGFAMVLLKLKGSGKISSVKIENPTGDVISGFVRLDTSTGNFIIGKGMEFVAANCTNKGSFTMLNASKESAFRLMVVPGEYPEGLNVSICDSRHTAMHFTTEPLSLSAGDVYSIEKEYTCDEDLVYYEGFDNFVWGGNIIKGTEGIGFSPSAEHMGFDSGLNLTGYEEAHTKVSYDNPGSGHIQPNVWNDVLSKTVAQVHKVSDSYITSRNIGDWLYMYYVQEHPGYILVGGPANRGIVAIPVLNNMKGIGDVVVKMRVALHSNFNGNLELRVIYGGIVKSAKINGKEIPLDGHWQYRSETGKATFVVDNSYFIPSSATAANKWNDIEVVISGANDGTRLQFQNSLTSGENLSIYLDKLEVRRVNDWKDDSNLRVLYWNIQNGMCTDQHNGYENFAKWVKKYNPDICIWTEAETIYKDKSNTSASDKYLPDNWDKVSALYGHPYAAVGGNRDNYPQAVTSRYPIQVVQKITNTNQSGKPIAHGSGHFAIDVNGKKINIVTMHMYPHAYGMGVSGSAAQAESKAKKEGDYYRQYEMQYLVDQTIKNPSYANEEYWLMGGDTNSHSRTDDWYTKYSTSDPTKLITHDVVLNNTNMKDVINHRECYGEQNNTWFRSRIDVMYASPKMFEAMTNSIMLMDSWTGPKSPWEFYSSFDNPSDHTPIIMDFKL